MPKASTHTASTVKGSNLSGAQALVLAAEKLFAKYGVEDVSLRQIVRTAGQSNNYAIQHHFGDKEGLIRAILELRLPKLNTMRAARLTKLRNAGALDVRGLLEALYMPVADMTDESGRHVYAQFLLRVHDTHITGLWNRDDEKVSAIYEIIDELPRHFPHLDMKTLRDRQELTRIMFLNAILLMDAKATKGLSPAAQKKYLAQALDMCVAALQAPAR